MLINIVIGLIVIGFTVSIQGYGTNFWLKYLEKKYFALSGVILNKNHVRVLIFTSFFILLLHLIQTSIWAFTYYVLHDITEFETFEKAMYFSLVTFTTLGYGDVTISSSHRMLSGFEAINGILLIGWSTAFMFSVVQYMWKVQFKIEKNIKNKKE